MAELANRTAGDRKDPGAVAATDEIDRLRAELAKSGDYCVESLWPEDVRDMEAEGGVAYGEVMSEDEILRTTWRAVKAYRVYVDASDARDEFVADAAESVVGAAELRARIESASRAGGPSASTGC